MKTFFNFNVLFFIAIMAGLIINPISIGLWIMFIFQVLIFIVKGKKNFLNR